MSNTDPRQERRLAAFKAVCARFELDPDADTTAAEDYHLTLEGEIQLTRFVAVTSTAGSEPIVYVKPVDLLLKNAKLDAVRYINDGLYAEVPLAIVDLDTLEIFRPEWRDVPWIKGKNLLKLEVPA